MEKPEFPVAIVTNERPDMKVFNSLPDWMKTKMKENLEFAGSPLEGALGGSEGEPKEEPKGDSEDW